MRTVDEIAHEIWSSINSLEYIKNRLKEAIEADRAQRRSKPSDSVTLGIHHKSAAEAVAAFQEAAGPESKTKAAYVAAGILSALVFIHEMEEN